MCVKNCVSPCENCTRVQNPKGCENKNCKDWKAWFLHRWAQIHAYGIRQNLGQGEGIL